jgi:uncharacterized membrane protein
MPILTQRRRILGLPIGRRRTNWMQAGRLAAMGAGTVAATAGAAAGEMRARSAVSGAKEKAKEEARTAEQAIGKVGDVADQVSRVGRILPGGRSKGGRGKGGRGEGEEREEVKKLRLIIKENIDIAVPLTTAYNQWTQFKELPKIMGSVQGVEQEADDETRWTVKIGPSARDWTAKILEQVPDQRIKWESTEGAMNRGVVTFHHLDDRLTRIQVEMEYVPNGIVEKVGNVFLAARRRTRNDLRLFKHHMELVGKESGGWRGEIHAGGETAAQGGHDGQAEQPEQPERAGQPEQPQESGQPEPAARARETAKTAPGASRSS